MTGHTPGPWRAERHGAVTAFVNGKRRQVASAQGDAIEHADPSVGVVELQAANVRLIAAAPEMLDTLEGLTANYDAHGFADESWWQAARDVIASLQSSERGS